MLQFQTLRRGTRGPDVELLQEGLCRSGINISVDGVFGSETSEAVRRFQKKEKLEPDEIVGPITWRSLTPYLTGYRRVAIRSGDTFFRLAQHYNTTALQIERANPKMDPNNLPVGEKLIIPLPFDVVPTNISCTSLVLALCIDGLAARYPMIRQGYIGNSVMGKPLYYLSIGTGAKQIFCNATHHANEWITSLVLLRFAEEYIDAVCKKSNIGEHSAINAYNQATLWLVPMVNPDGVDLVTKRLLSGNSYNNARKIAADYPAVPFPNGWKANIQGIDPNLQYPAGWEEAKRNKAALGYVSPSPRDYVGTAPLQAPESRSVYTFTLSHSFDRTLSFHSQGRVIYYNYLDHVPKGSLALGKRFSAVSGYSLETVPSASAYAGFKDWFILKYNRPGFTVEVGKGKSPLPLSQFPEIYRANRAIIAEALYI